MARCAKCGRDGQTVYVSDDDPPLCPECHDRDSTYVVFRWFVILAALVVAIALAALLAEGG